MNQPDNETGPAPEYSPEYTGETQPERAPGAAAGYVPPVYNEHRCPECNVMYAGKDPRTGRCADRRGCAERAQRVAEARSRPKSNGNGNGNGNSNGNGNGGH